MNQSFCPRSITYHSVSHKSSVEALKIFQLPASSQKGSVTEQLDPNCNPKANEINREILKVFINAFLFCAKRELLLRGHREGVKELSCGNH